MVVDLVTTEVIRGALTYVSEEMGLVLRNAAYSPNIKERMDHSCTIFDGKRRLVSQAEHIPVHLGSMILAVQEGLKRFKDELKKGDMLLFNDPYISGTHLPDLTLIHPIFHNDDIVAYTANKAHHSDVGGRSPGSMAADATEVYQEGLIIPPVKLLRKGKLNQEVVDLILSNVRTPKVSLGDLRAQIAANHIGAKRVLDVFEKYGVITVQEAIERIMDHSERVLRARIDQIPKGKYGAEDLLESTGLEDKRLKIKVTLTVSGNNLGVDYSGTSTQVEGPVNAVRGVTLAGVYYTVKSVLDPEIPVNDGYLRPIAIYAPEGCILNPTPPAAVAAGNVETSQRNVDVLLRAFSQVLPDKVCAACQGTMNNITIGGLHKGALWSFYETVGGGFGGRPGLDGENGIQCHMTNTMNTPIESLEAAYPIKVVNYELRRGSGGAGRWRGGMGLERSLQLLSSSAILSVLAERSRISPWGLFGGSSGACSEYSVTKPDGSKVILNSKCTARIGRDDIVVIRTPGGGGYGDPLERDVQSVLKDVADGLVTCKAALNDYYVAIDKHRQTGDLTAKNPIVYE